MQYLPGRWLILFFAIVAITCGAIVSRSASHDKALSLMIFPIFVVAAVLGLWQSGRLSAAESKASDE